jgi:hypothetical protein
MSMRFLDGIIPIIFIVIAFGGLILLAITGH